MAFTQADLDAITEAIADGALICRYEDKSVTYRSLDEMLKVKAMIEDDVATANGEKKPVTTVRFRTRTGW